MKTRLTDLSVQKLPEGLYMDERTPSFGLRVGKLRKTWLVVKGQTRTQVRLGHYPAMSLSEARKRALVTLGSPMQEKPQVSFPDALETFLALPRWRHHSHRVLTSSLRHFTWKRQLDKITHEDVVQALAVIKGTSARAHALKDIRTFFNWCVPRYLASSPANGIKMETQPSRDRILTNDELKAVWNAAEGTFGTIVKLLILTGQRKMEIGTLRYENVTGDIITIPAEVAKNGHEHTLPIGPLARLLIPKQGTGYIFRSAKDPEAMYNGYTFHLKQLQKASETSGWTLHDLRRTFVSIHSELGTPIHVAEKMVNHVSGTFAGVRGIYDRHAYIAEMTEAMTAYEAHIRKLVA